MQWLISSMQFEDVYTLFTNACTLGANLVWLMLKYMLGGPAVDPKFSHPRLPRHPGRLGTARQPTTHHEPVRHQRPAVTLQLGHQATYLGPSLTAPTPSCHPTYGLALSFI